MGRLILSMLVSLTVSGCAVMTAVGGTAVEGLVHIMQGEEASFPISMRGTLVAVQRGLSRADLDVSVLEPVEEGYLIAFGNENLDGKVVIEKQTRSLTSISIKVKRGVSREESIEQALVEVIRKESEKIEQFSRFEFARYKNIREKPAILAKHVGWYLPGKLLEVKPLKDSKWLRIKMPSGRSAYLKGNLAATASK